MVAASRAYPAFAARIAAAGGGLDLSTVAVAIAEPQPAAPVAEQADRLPESINDPLEGFNRAVFAVNDVIDVFIFRPLAALYGFITPAPVKASARIIFANVNEPVVFTNQLLQFDLRGAGITVGRFVINSTVDVAGVFDVADSIGFAAHRSPTTPPRAELIIRIGPSSSAVACRRPVPKSTPCSMKPSREPLAHNARSL